jgi:hypothetical protein
LKPEHADHEQSVRALLNVTHWALISEKDVLLVAEPDSGSRYYQRYCSGIRIRVSDHPAGKRPRITNDFTILLSPGMSESTVLELVTAALLWLNREEAADLERGPD